jgi:hypothetical protein
MFIFQQLSDLQTDEYTLFNFGITKKWKLKF